MFALILGGFVALWKIAISQNAGTSKLKPGLVVFVAVAIFLLAWFRIAGPHDSLEVLLWKGLFLLIFLPFVIVIIKRFFLSLGSSI